MSDSTKQVLIHPRLDVHIHRALVDYANRTHRSMTGAINHILEQYLLAEDTTTGKETNP